MPQAVGASSPQLNVRIDAKVRRRGDAALANMGFAPTQAVRALWGLACGGAHDLELLKSALDAGQAVGEGQGFARSADGSERDEALERGRALFAAALEREGLTLPEASAQPDDSELYAEALMGRLAERGLA